MNKLLLCWLLFPAAVWAQSYTAPFASSATWKTPVASLTSPTYSSVGTALSSTVTNPTISQWSGAGWAALYQTTTSNPQVTLYYNANAYTNLVSGVWLNSGNSPTVEAAIEASSTTSWPSVWNVYSTASVGGSTYSAPSAYHGQQNYYWSPTPYFPSGATPSAGADSYMAVWQPNGWVLETLGTIVLSNGNIVCLYAGYTWPGTGGSGLQGGRRASMVPNYAGLIRNGEYTAGTIPHALALDLPPAAIKQAINWPAVAVDRNNSYTGTVVPYGALLAIPAGTTNTALGITTTLGTVIANAARTYGAYVVDQTSAGDSIFDSETGATDLPAYSGAESSDLQSIINALQLVTFTPGTDSLPQAVTSGLGCPGIGAAPPTSGLPSGQQGLPCS